MEHTGLVAAVALNLVKDGRRCRWYSVRRRGRNENCFCCYGRSDVTRISDVDTKLTMRQFQVAFSELRQYSRKLDLPKTELDIDGTIDSTCNQGGYLKLEFQQPRKNTVKLNAFI
ncbi:MAG: hypothetical protein ACLUR5_05280 [Eubacterium ventriosum]